MPIGMPDPRHGVRCPKCHALVAGGSSFCPHCGSGMAQVQEELQDLPCPACNEEGVHMVVWGLQPTEDAPGGFPVAGCRSCGGAWIATETLDAIIAAAAEQAPPSHAQRQPKRRTVPPQKVMYRKCPRCGDMMARRNFARISGVIIDECRQHGSFFDAGELKDVLDFVRSGGLQAAAKRERELEREFEKREAAFSGHGLPMTGVSDLRLEESAVGRFLRWAQGWIIHR